MCCMKNRVRCMHVAFTDLIISIEGARTDPLHYKLHELCILYDTFSICHCLISISSCSLVHANMTLYVCTCMWMTIWLSCLKDYEVYIIRCMQIHYSEKLHSMYYRTLYNYILLVSLEHEKIKIRASAGKTARCFIRLKGRK